MRANRQNKEKRTALKIPWVARAGHPLVKDSHDTRANEATPRTKLSPIHH